MVPQGPHNYDEKTSDDLLRASSALGSSRPGAVSNIGKRELLLRLARVLARLAVRELALEKTDKAKRGND